MDKREAICSVLRIVRIYRNIMQESIRISIQLDVSKYETGSVCPGIPSFVCLCKHLRVHPGDVLDWAELLERGKINQEQICHLLTG